MYHVFKINDGLQLIITLAPVQARMQNVKVYTRKHGKVQIAVDQVDTLSFPYQVGDCACAFLRGLLNDLNSTLPGQAFVAHYETDIKELAADLEEYALDPDEEFWRNWTARSFSDNDRGLFSEYVLHLLFN